MTLPTEVKRHTGWFAQLNTGEWVFERKGGAGELSAWQALLARCETDNVQIIDLYMRRGGVTVRALPFNPRGTGAQGFFQAYNEQTSLNGKGVLLLQGIGAVYGDKIFIVWLDDAGGVACDVRDLSADFVHTDQRKLVDVMT